MKDLTYLCTGNQIYQERFLNHEPYESRGSRTDLREAVGEVPAAYSACVAEETERKQICR